MDIKIGVDFTEQRIQDVLTSAFEGGIGYWACIVAYVMDGKETKDRNRLPEYPYISLPLMEGGAVVMVDTEERRNPQAERWTLNRAALEKGLSIMANGSTALRRHFGNLLSEDDDAETADVLVQCALFGEIVYG